MQFVCCMADLRAVQSTKYPFRRRPSHAKPNQARVSGGAPSSYGFFVGGGQKLGGIRKGADWKMEFFTIAWCGAVEAFGAS